MYRKSTALYPLSDLDQVLLSKKETLKLTPEEVNFWLTWKYEMTRNFSVSALAGGTAVWAVAARCKLSGPFRILLSSGAATSFGMWIVCRSLYSCADKILKMDGSILQKELANIMVTKYQNEPSLMPLMSKHFYSERIFDDSTSNKFRWRHRNFFSDNAAHDHGMHDSDSYDKTQGNPHNDSYNNSHAESVNVNDSRRTNLETKHNFTKAGPDIMAELEPFDFLFGYGAPVEEVHYPNIPNKPSGTHNRRHRRSHRRHRMRNPDDLSNSKHSATL